MLPPTMDKMPLATALFSFAGVLSFDMVENTKLLHRSVLLH